MIDASRLILVNQWPNCGINIINDCDHLPCQTIIWQQVEGGEEDVAIPLGDGMEDAGVEEVALDVVVDDITITTMTVNEDGESTIAATATIIISTTMNRDTPRIIAGAEILVI